MKKRKTTKMIYEVKNYYLNEGNYIFRKLIIGSFD